MKKTAFIILLSAVCLSACQNRMHLNGIDSAVEEAFNNQYPNAWDVEWEQQAGNTIVMDFRDGLYEREAWFNYDASWIQTRTELPLREVPAQIVEAAMAYTGKGWHIEDADHYLSSSTPSEFYVLECDQIGTKREIKLTLLPDGTLAKPNLPSKPNEYWPEPGKSPNHDPNPGTPPVPVPGTDPGSIPGTGTVPTPDPSSGTGTNIVGDIFAAAKLTFASMFPGARSVEWEVEHGKLNVEFIWENAEKEAWFLTDGTWLSTETEIRISGIPGIVSGAAMTYLGSGWHIDSAEYWEVKDAPFSFYVLECEHSRSDREITLRIAPDGTILSQYKS